METRAKELQTIQNHIHNLQQQANETTTALQNTQTALADIQTKMLTTETLAEFLAQLRAETDNKISTAVTSTAQPSLLGGSPGVGRPHQPDNKLRLIFPRFASGDPTDWLFVVNQYFTYYNTHPADRLLIASMHLDAPASRWYQGLMAERRLPTWEAFMTALLSRFGPSEYEDPAGQLARVTQTGTVCDYQSSFEELSSRVRGITPAFLQSIFIAGLQPRIRRAVQSQRPVDLHDAFRLARLHEDQQADYTRQPQKQWSSRLHSSTLSQALGGAPTTGTTLAQQTTIPTHASRLTVKRLTADEMQQRRQAGLCFNCDEKYNRHHKCQGRATLLYLDGIEDDPGECDEDRTRIEPAEPEISLNALLGRYCPKSMRMIGCIHSSPVQVLIDGGSTNNFISSRAAHFINLTASTTTPFRVRVGNGATLQCTAVCQEVPLLIQSHQFTTDLFILDLEGSDVILGVQWLETLGPVTTDWSHLTMTFSFNGRPIQLQGDNSLQAQVISTSSLHKLVTADGITSSFMCMAATSSDFTAHLQVNDSQSIVAAAIQPLLQQFADLFVAPTGLPPNRNIDHRIPLKAGTDAVNVRPYRYPHFQKNEIERLVAELLQSGAIRPNRSAFSSPVLLVKKKDGS
jgi:Retroviral aspartyl protease/Retrotransposon gag protein